MSRLNYLKILSLSGETLVDSLQDWELIPRVGTYLCPRCKTPLKIEKDAFNPDKFRWRCPNRQYKERPAAKKIHCRKSLTLRHGTFFEKFQLGICQILAFIDWWVHGNYLEEISRQIEVSLKTCADLSRSCREVLLNCFILHPEKLGGPGKIVEIGTSKFGQAANEQWVFGGYERGSGRVFMVPVEDRDADTLIPLIEVWIEKGTTINSDIWKAYDCLNQIGYQHLKVDHKRNFVDPETGTHTNGIVSSWRAAKASFKSSDQIKAHIPGNLARYMFFKKCKMHDSDRTLEFFKLAGKLYDPTAPRDVPPIEDTDSD